MLKQTLYFSVVYAFIFTSQVLNAAEIGTSSFGGFLDNNDSRPKLIQLDASLSNLQYFSEDPSENSTQQKGQIEGVFQSSDFLMNYKFHGLAGTFSAPKSSYFAVPEAYVGLHGVDELNFLSIGRKREVFSFADGQQNLGLFNPYFSNDLLEFREQGLVGAHVGAHISNVGFHAGYYPYYVPNQGPQVYAEDGKIKSANRWAKRPPQQLSFASQNHDIVYAIRDYSISDVINHDGYAGSVFIDSPEKGARPLIQVSYARKPISEVPISRDTYATAMDFIGQVKLSPVVEYSKTSAIDLNIDGSLLKSTISYIEDHPENGTAVDGEALQHLEPLKIYSVWLSTDLSQLLERTFIVELSYAEVVGGEIRDLMADGSLSITTFATQRTQFKKPLAIAFQSDVAIVNKKPVLTSLKWTYDSALKGSVLSGLVAYEAFRQVNVNLGFDILGVEDNSSTDGNFLKDNQANDRIYGGLQYVF